MDNVVPGIEIPIVEGRIAVGGDGASAILPRDDPIVFATNRPFPNLQAPYYKLTRKIGKGSFATVYLATHQLTGQKVAVKAYDREELERTTGNGLSRVRQEAKIMWNLAGHPHIVQFYECVETPECVYIIMEYVQQGDLHDFGMISSAVPTLKLAEREVRRVFQQVISAVDYCHQHGVAHQDIKAENILIDAQNDIKLADFGLSCIMANGDCVNTCCGTHQYAAPEMFTLEKPHSGKAADVWSCGVILYALLCGKLPFEEENRSRLTWRIRHGDYEVPRSQVGEGARDLLRRMLMVDPSKRITISEIKQHSWFCYCVPPYIANPVPSYQLDKIDVESFLKVVNLGCAASYLITSLWNRTSNQATVAYYALLSKKNSEIRCKQQKLSAESGQSTSEQSGSHGHEPSASSNISPRKVPSGAFVAPGTDQKWTIGLQSLSSFSLVQSKVRKILADMGVFWQKVEESIQQWLLYCRLHRVTKFSNNSCTTSISLQTLSVSSVDRSRCGMQLKFALKLSKVSRKGLSPLSLDLPTEGYMRIRSVEQAATGCSLGLTSSPKNTFYILDLQNLEGPLPLFHDICGTLLSRLLL